MFLKAALETIRRYNAGEITERQACDWFGVDRLTLRTALAAPAPALDVAEVERTLLAILPQAALDDIRDIALVARVFVGEYVAAYAEDEPEALK